MHNFYMISHYWCSTHTDLRFSEQHVPQLSSVSEAPTVTSSLVGGHVPLPQSTLYGSQGLPLHHVSDLRGGSYIRIDLSQFQLGVGLTPCSLETLGIVPTRSLFNKGRSLASLVTPWNYSRLPRGTFKQHYPPSSSAYHPVIIRGIIPGSPAAVIQNLHEG